MSIERAIVENLRKLSLEKQREVLHFSEILTHSKPSLFESMTPHEQAEDWKQFVEAQLKDTPGLPDEALRRDNIYD
ncbi:hypothetical protein [Crocosphaera sp. Alani8]|uniref:hypothetical protein n=1 Tax=Crocosphaera sp. Alani8 TaxID=3038952 RepID=UPI00313ACDE6